MLWETFLIKNPHLNESEPPWDYGQPFVIGLRVKPDDIDVMGHTNNVVYLKWLEQVAWAHSNALGLDWKTYQENKRALVARRHEIDYLGSSVEGDELLLGTWIVENDKRLSIKRAYQLIRLKDNKTLLRGLTSWVCVDTETGKPKRMPTSYVSGYQVTAV